MQKILFSYFILCFYCMPLHAQFVGGKGDGIHRSSAIQTKLNGDIAGDKPLFQGGIGDGFDKSIVSFGLNGTNVSLLYSGGRGDGFVNSTGSFALNGMNIADLYNGGSGDGFDKQQYSGFLNNISSIVLYSGGIGDGFDNKSFSGFLNDIGSIVLYNGGSGDGFDNKLFSGSVSGTSTDIIFSGGAGDGFTNAQIQAFLNGLSADALYSGGAGDGFARSQFSGTLVVLPIQLLSFDATARETYVLVKWVTTAEKDNAYFTIERSQNGVLFDNLMQVPGRGNSSTVQVYTENDIDPLNGRSFYRLKWTDVDGRSLYSDIRSVLFKQKQTKDFLLFPNPNKGNNVIIQLEGLANTEKVAVQISDMSGKVVTRSEKPNISGNRINISLIQKLAKGSYVVQVIRNGESSSKVLIVQ